MKKFTIPFLSLLLMAGCGDGKADAVKKAASEEVQRGPIVDLSSEDMPLEVEMPFGHEVTADDETVFWNDEFGRLEVKAGENFAITITEEPGSIEQFKGDLERDLLRSHTVVEETPDMLIYRSEYPDEDLVFLHFYRIVRTSDREYVVEDMADMKFNEAEVRAMSKAVSAKVAA